MECGGGVRGNGRERAGWRMLTRGFGNLRYMTPVMGIAAVLGVNWALLSLLTAIIPPLFIVVGLLSGPMVAVYGTMLYLSRDFRVRTMLGGVLLAATGLLHLPWLFWISDITSRAMPASAAGVDNFLFSQITLTGVVFAIVIGGITASWHALCAMLGGTMLASLVSFLGFLMPSVGFFFGLDIAILHLTIVATLLFTTLATVAAQFRPGACKSCGYDLAGNVGGVCPECGFDALRPAPHPFDLEVTGEEPRI